MEKSKAIKLSVAVVALAVGIALIVYQTVYSKPEGLSPEDLAKQSAAQQKPKPNEIPREGGGRVFKAKGEK